MKIILGSDHRGQEIRNFVFDYLIAHEHDVFVTEHNGSESIDYPDVAARAAFDVGSGLCDYGILICGTGIGMCIVANKFPGIRAATCHNEVVAELSRKHNNANILCLAGDLLGEQSTLRIVEKWLTTPFDDGHHTGRLEKIRKLESQNYAALATPEVSDWSHLESIVLEPNVSVQNQPVCGVA